MVEETTGLLHAGLGKVAAVNVAPAKVLIVARPGRFTEGLQALLANTAQIEVVGQVDGGPELEERVAQTQPALVLLDAHLCAEPYQAVLARLSTQWPQIRRLVLANSHQQQEAARHAGADGVLLKGFVIPDLIQAIQALLA